VPKRKTGVGRSFRVLGSVMMQCSFLISECKTVSEANPNSAKERDCSLKERKGFRASVDAMQFCHQ